MTVVIWPPRSMDCAAPRNAAMHALSIAGLPRRSGEILRLGRGPYRWTRPTDRAPPVEAGVGPVLADRRELPVQRRLDPGHLDPCGRGRTPQPRCDVDGEVLRQGRRHDEPQLRPPQARRLAGRLI